MTSRLSAFLVAALATFMTANFAAAAGVTSFYVPEQTFAGDTTYATVRYEGDVSGFEWKMGTIDDRNVRQPPFSVQRTRMTTLTFKPTQAGRHWLSVIAVDNAGNEAGDELVREFSVEPVRLLGISLDVQGEIPQYSRVHFRPSVEPARNGAITIRWEKRPLGSDTWEDLIPNPAGTPTTERHGFYHCANTLGTYEVRAIGVSGGIEQVAEPITVTVVNRPAQEFFVDYFDHFDEDRDNREHWTRGTLRIEHPPMGISVCNNDLAISLYLKAAPGALADSTGFSADYTMEFDVKQARETMFHKVDARSFMPILMNEGGNPTETYVWFTHPLRTFEGRLNVPSTPEQLLWKIGLSVQAESDASASAYRNLNIAISSDQAYDIDADGDPQSEDPNAPNYYPKRDH